MTDMSPESSLSGFASLVPQGFWSPTEEASAPKPAATGSPQKSAASLASAAQHLLDSMVRKRVPRMETLRRQLQSAGCGPSLEHIAAAIQQLHSAMAALDFLAGRSGGEAATDFARQGVVVATASEHLQGLASAFAEHHATQGPVSRLLWIELVLESASLQKRVRQGAHWLAQMDRELHARRQAATAEVTHRALEELGRRGRALHERLQTVHRLCGHARSVHVLCEQLAGQRTGLCAALQDKIRPAGTQLQGALQPLLEAVAYRPLVPEELMAAIEARHRMQVLLTQARAEVALVQSASQEIASHLTWIEEKALHLG